VSSLGGCEVFTAMAVKSVVFWDVMLYSSEKSRRFEGIYLYCACNLLLAGFLLGLLFNPEDGGYVFRNVGLFQNYTALLLRRPYSSTLGDSQ
jgi:hypothetical protein